jgi:hypothetical protein
VEAYQQLTIVIQKLFLQQTNMSHIESHITQREYYKIFAGTNQEQNNEKLHLGYEASTTEVTLKKDQTTFFHVPFFAETQHIQDSDLIGAGAIPGPIPAGADKIFKKLGDYSNSTPWGNTTQRQDGTWLCSWLYAVSSESPKWLDRYYNPGNLSYQEALSQGINLLTYQKHDPIYYDVPSTLTLESGVWYQYFHQGEKTAAEFIKTFAGNDSSRLRLEIDDWGATPLDKSIYNNSAIIENFSSNWVYKELTPGYIDRNILSFDNNDFINCQIPHDNSYNLKNEFSIAFWVKSKDWSESPSTQLVGNLNRGGYSLFFDDLKYYPFFVVSETTYGHFFLFNQESQIYNEKNSQVILGQPINFFNVHINGESELIGVEGQSGNNLQNTSYKVYKFNHLGEVQALIRDQNNTTVGMNGIPKLSILDGNNNTIVITTSGTYTFDQDLILTSYLSSQPYIENEQICFNFNNELIRQANCLDVKYDSNNTKWYISLSGQLYYDNTIFSSVSNATNIHIDPNNDLWVLAGTNLVYKVDTNTKQIKSTFYVGTDATTTDTKNISFIYSYTRSTGVKTWYAMIYHSNEKTLYQVTLDGVVKQAIFLPQKLNILETETARQDRDALTFLSKGDFTGYEWKRIFHKIKYNNNTQMQFKIAVNSSELPNKNTIYKISVPVSQLVNNEWHLIVVTLKNKQLNLYIDNYLRDTINLDFNLDLNYIFKNNLFIGCPTGKSENLNKEINSQSLIWDGYIDTIRIYDYAIDESLIQYFIKEKIQGDDMIWNIITAPLQYVESIDRFFKHRVPGHKSNYFNIKINQSEISDPQLKETIENDIRAALLEIIPKNTELLSIKWD